MLWASLHGSVTVMRHLLCDKAVNCLRLLAEYCSRDTSAEIRHSQDNFLIVSYSGFEQTRKRSCTCSWPLAPTQAPIAYSSLGPLVLDAQREVRRISEGPEPDLWQLPASNKQNEL